MSNRQPKDIQAIKGRDRSLLLGAQQPAQPWDDVGVEFIPLTLGELLTVYLLARSDVPTRAPKRAG